MLEEILVVPVQYKYTINVNHIIQYTSNARQIQIWTPFLVQALHFFQSQTTKGSKRKAAENEYHITSNFEKFSSNRIIA
jgi:hypothetical protein